MPRRLEYCSPSTNVQDRAVRPMFLWIPVLLLIGGSPFFMVRPPEFGHGNARGQIAIEEMAYLRDKVYAFHADSGRYPTAAEGLAILTRRQASGTGEACLVELPRDPWGHDYIYSPTPMNGLPFDLHSLGGRDVHKTWYGIACPSAGQ